MLPAAIELPPQQRPRPITLLPIEWVVSGGMICLAPRDYESLSINMLDILRYVKSAEAFAGACE